jgi:hypothetical protein
MARASPIVWVRVVELSRSVNRIVRNAVST